MLAVSLVPFVDHNVRGSSSAFDRRLGGASYALYLLHWGVLCVYGSYGESMSGARKLLWAAVYVAVSCALALLVQRFIDAPLEARRHKWLAQRS
jgi:peptidoglycan/LPS O-acetylase OafA/YrhL